MFKVGDLIVYGNTGVCTVEKIGRPDLSGISDDKEYYTLLPYYSRNSRIFTPCDNDKVVMRPIMSKKEAEKLLREIPKIEILVITDEKKREECYKETMKTCDCREFVSILKTIYNRKKTRLAEGKKVTASDERYYNMAEDKLFGELAIALGLEKSQMKTKIRDNMLEV